MAWYVSNGLAITSGSIVGSFGGCAEGRSTLVGHTAKRGCPPLTAQRDEYLNSPPTHAFSIRGLRASAGADGETVVLNAHDLGARTVNFGETPMTRIKAFVSSETDRRQEVMMATHHSNRDEWERIWDDDDDDGNGYAWRRGLALVVSVSIVSGLATYLWQTRRSSAQPAGRVVPSAADIYVPLPPPR